MNVSTRLCLHQDEDDEIFVDSVLHQHHIDGIRFLYKQFKKKKPGVIINNPLGCGNSLQVALFLGAIRHLLDKPILILCEQSEELTWLDHFQKLTQCYNVGVGAPSPFVKKSIFINTMERLELFCRRDWGAIVVDNDVFLKEKMLQAKFKADFKIWITSVNMKDNLETFSSIHKWIFPKDKINIEDFKPKPGSRADAISKIILLDAFLADIVCRTALEAPFENSHDKSDETPRKASMKNKDATGTKIKRSKRSLDVTNTSKAESSGAEAGTSAKVPRIDTPADDFCIDSFKSKKDNICDDNPHKSNIESCIRDEEPIKFDPSNEFDDVSHNSKESQTEFEEDDPMLDIAKRFRPLDSTMPMEAANPDCSMDSDANSDSLLPVPEATDDTSQNSDSHFLMTEAIDDTSRNSDSILPMPEAIDETSQQSQPSNDSDYREKKQTALETLMDNLLNEVKEEEENFIANSEEDSSKSDMEHYKADEESIDNKVNVAPDIVHKNIDKKEEGTSTVEVQNGIIKGNPNIGAIGDLSDVKEESKKVEDKESDKFLESPKKHDLDAKLKEMDERAFKKFQGSILDSLF